MVYRSNEHLSHTPHSHQSASKLERLPVNRNPFTFGKPVIQGTSSPKITFNIRSTLPSNIPAVSPIRSVPIDTGRPITGQMAAPRVDFIPPQPQVLQKSQKRGSSGQSQETKNLHITFNPGLQQPQAPIQLERI